MKPLKYYRLPGEFCEELLQGLAAVFERLWDGDPERLVAICPLFRLSTYQVDVKLYLLTKRQRTSARMHINQCTLVVGT